MTGAVVRSGYGTHTCEPPITKGQFPADRTGLSLGTVWRCSGCGKRWEVVLDHCGKTWVPIHISWLRSLFT